MATSEERLLDPVNPPFFRHLNENFVLVWLLEGSLKKHDIIGIFDPLVKFGKIEKKEFSNTNL